MTTGTDPVARSRPHAAWHIAGVVALLEQIDPARVDEIVEVLVEAAEAGRCVFVLGNGGSAATAEHFVADLSHVTPLRALSLTSNTSQLTATANDVGYERIFERQLRTWMSPGDVVVGFSVSGTSPNCVAAFDHALAHGARTVGFVGSGGGRLIERCHHAVVTPSVDHRSVESVHLVVAHTVAAALAERGLHGR